MMVKGVEGVDSELEFEPLSEREELAKSHIPIVDARLTKLVTSRIAINTRICVGEAGQVDALVLL